MSKFKVGDQVVGNKKANRYGITKEGWKGTVTAVNTYQIRVYGFGSVDEEGFWVDPDCFDLVVSTPNILIFARKNRIVATITKGDQKFTQSVSLHKVNGDFKTAVKMVVEKLLDKFEAREQSHFTASTIDWEAFKRGEFAVHCDTEEKAEAFLKECDEQGIRWADGTSLLVNSKWTEYKTETLYGFDGEYGLYYGTAWGFNNKPSIDYTPSKPAVKEVKRPAKVGEWIKVVDGSGHDNGTGIFKVTSLNWNNDLPDWVYVNGKSSGIIRGDQYVVLENYQPEQSSIDSNAKAEQPTPSSGMREVKRLAQAGEIVKVVNACDVNENDYSNGDFLKIYSCEGNKARYGVHAGCFLWPDEYVVVENFDYHAFPKNEPFRKAKVGDKIKVVKVVEPHTPTVKIGDIHTVTFVDSWSVHTDKQNAFHDTDQEYIIIEEAPEEIQIGDTVKVVNNGKCYTRYEEWFVKNAPQYLGKFAYGGMPKNGGSYKVLMKNDKDGLKYVIQEIDWPNDAVYLMEEKGIEKVR